MNEWDDWDQTEDYTSVPLLSMSCEERQPETESSDQWHVSVKRVKSTRVKTRTGNRQFVCNNKFEAIDEQDQDKKKVRFDYDNDASTSCGSECTQKCETDPNLVGILLSSSSESVPLCEMSSEWAPMPQPLMFDSGAAKTVIRRTWFPNHKTVESEESKRGVFYTTAEGSTVENRRRKDVAHVDIGRSTTEESDVPWGKRQQGTKISLEDGEEWKHSGV